MVKTGEDRSPQSSVLKDQVREKKTEAGGCRRLSFPTCGAAPTFLYFDTVCTKTSPKLLRVVRCVCMFPAKESQSLILVKQIYTVEIGEFYGVFGK